MSGTQTPATEAARRAKIVHTVHDLGEDGVPDDGRGYGAVAAEVMDVDPARVFKTILVKGLAKGPGLAVAIVPVSAMVDLKAVAKALGVKKVSTADPAEAERVTGYVLGGISPLGQRKALPTVIDVSADAHDTIMVSAGRRGLELELAPADLVRLTRGIRAPIAKDD